MVTRSLTADHSVKHIVDYAHIRIPRINPEHPRNQLGNPCHGSVHWAPLMSCWWTFMAVGGLMAVLFYFSWSALLVFLALTALTLLGGHSLGMHRRLIHGSYQCPIWLEYSLVYLGVLVGLAGPIGMIRTHDTRDWAQRHPECHSYFAHRAPWWRDFYWQIHCKISLVNPPYIEIENSVEGKAFYQWLERTWMLQQLPLALLLWVLGGIEWVLWGICLRVSVSIFGHWLIGYWAHRDTQQMTKPQTIKQETTKQETTKQDFLADDNQDGNQLVATETTSRLAELDWLVSTAGVQGYNIRFCGLITMGECWHNNHHAFPESAKLGLQAGQTDPGWWVLLLLQRLGLAWNIKQCQDLPVRSELVPIEAIEAIKATKVVKAN